MVRDAAPPAEPAVLQVTRGVQVGERITLPESGRVEVGRDANAGAQLIGPQVSRRHFAILHDGADNYAILDLGSGNGTFVNGKRVTEAALAHGDRIAAGGTECRFVATGARVPERTRLHVAPGEPGGKLRVELDLDAASVRAAGIERIGAQRMFELALPCSREQSPDRLTYATLETLQVAAQADRSALLECVDDDPPIAALAVRRAPEDPPALHRALPAPLLLRVAREKRAMVLRMGKETMLLAPVPQHDRLQVLFLGRDSEESPSFDESAVGAAVVAGELLGRALERVGGGGVEDTRAVHMRLLIEGTDDMVFLLDDVARFTYVNHWPGTVKHADTDSLLGRNIAELVPLSDREELLAALDAALEGAEREFLETTLQRGDGSAVPVRLEFSPVHNPNGAVVAIRGHAHDQREMRAIRATSTGGERGTAPPPRDRNAPPGAEALLGDSAAMRLVLQQIEQVQGQPYPVLVYGETGTGKELVARALHADGDRHDGPFVAVNCAALPDSLLEAELFGHTRGAFTGAQAQRVGLVASADGGTLFLDEIGEMGPAMQARLLRVLETSEVRPVGGDVGEQVDVRVVAATHRNLEEMAESGRFRHDLLYRLDVVRIELPPLRARPDDIPILVEHGLFVVERETGNRRGIDRAAVEALQQYRWPGNVRELLNVIRRCALQSRGEVIQFEDLPAGIKQIESPVETSPAGEPQSLREIERDAIVRALKAAGGNKQRAAQILGMPRATFYRRIKQYDLQHGVGPKTERR